jgi:hypothetical protein
MKNFGYQAERFHSAVLALMLPHPEGEAEAIASAFQECHLAFRDMDRDDLDAGAREWMEKIEEYICVDAGDDLHGKWLLKAEKLNVEEKSELSECVYELNSWFHMYFWQS